MKLIRIKLRKSNIAIYIYLCTLGHITIDLSAQNFFSEKKIHYLNKYSISGGFLVNQANHNHLAYKPNQKILFNTTINVLSLKNYSIFAGLGYRSKSLIGYGNYPWLKLINNLEPLLENNFQPYYKIDFFYLNADLAFKVAFFQKYKLQPFLFIGGRFNKILKYSDSLDIYNKYFVSKFQKRDNYINSFFGVGCYYKIKSYLNVQLFFEKNNDIIPYKQLYFNSNPQSKEKEIRFLSYSFQIGIQYTLPKSENKPNPFDSSNNQ